MKRTLLGWLLLATEVSALLSLGLSKEKASKPIRRRDEDIVITNYDEITYVVELGFGTPSQPVKLIFDTGSSLLWVNPNCDNVQSLQEECEQAVRYDPDASLTDVSLGTGGNTTYGSGAVVFEYMTDSISIPDSDVILQDVQFGYALDSAGIPHAILGASFGNGSTGDNATIDHANFIDELYRQNVTNSRAFSVAIGGNDDDDGGVVVFGGVDTRKFAGNLSTVPILAPQEKSGLQRYWVQMTAFGSTNSSGESRAYDGGSLPVILDTGSTISQLPESLLQGLGADLGGYVVSGLGVTQVIVDCDRYQEGGDEADTTVDVSFGGRADSATTTTTTTTTTTISIPVREFVWEYNGLCYLGAQSTTDETEDEDEGADADESGDNDNDDDDHNDEVLPMILGAPFMRGVYAVFDQDNMEISMAPYVDCGTNQQDLPAGAGAVGAFVGECEPEQKSGAAAVRSMGWRVVVFGVVAQVVLWLVVL
ncbi:aspartic peptidase domain-containing protein [Xylariomycetidae sp. FL2044]|nr:aspartic peptidase domain-containing protein [Xylariomycetidae sp. FL2044]